MEKQLPIGNGIYITVSDIHRFGTDAVLLADFAAPSKKERACDLGSGCGIIPVIWRARGMGAEITAVDIQPDACGLMERTAEENRLDIKIVNADLRGLSERELGGTFDLVTMNPPYKAGNDGIKSDVEGRRIARHETLCGLRDVTSCAARLLRFGGRLCICQRPSRLCDVISDMRADGIEPKRLRMVHQRPGTEPMLFLCEGKRGSKPGLRVSPPLYIEDGDGLSDEMKRINSVFFDGGDKNER